MAEDAAHSSRLGDNEAARLSDRLIAKQSSELPVEGKWPKAWRVLFLCAAAVAAWLLFVSIARWI